MEPQYKRFPTLTNDWIPKYLWTQMLEAIDLSVFVKCFINSYQFIAFNYTLVIFGLRKQKII